MNEIEWYQKKKHYLKNIVKCRCLLDIWFALRSTKRGLARNQNMYVFLWKISYDMYLRNETFRNSSRQSRCNLIMFQNRVDNVIDIIITQRWNRRLRQLTTKLLRFPSTRIISWHVIKIFSSERKFKTDDNIKNNRLKLKIRIPLYHHLETIFVLIEVRIHNIIARKWIPSFTTQNLKIRFQTKRSRNDTRWLIDWDHV